MRVIEPRKKVIAQLKKLGFSGSVVCATLGKSIDIQGSSFEDLAKKVFERLGKESIIYLGEVYYRLNPPMYWVWIAGDKTDDEYGSYPK